MEIFSLILSRAAVFFFGATFLLLIFGRFQMIVPADHVAVACRILFTAFLVTWLLAFVVRSDGREEGSLISININAGSREKPADK